MERFLTEDFFEVSQKVWTKMLNDKYYAHGCDICVYNCNDNHKMIHSYGAACSNFILSFDKYLAEGGFEDVQKGNETR